MSKNVETLRQSHGAFNSRDFEAITNLMTEDVVYHDHARDVVFRGRAEMKQFLQGWVTAFSNASVSSPTYTDAGATVVCEFRGTGTNDGPMGPLPPSGKQLDCAFCEIFRFNEQGKIVSGAIYYDQLTIMMQLGHAQGQASGQA